VRIGEKINYLIHPLLHSAVAEPLPSVRQTVNQNLMYVAKNRKFISGKNYVYLGTVHPIFSGINTFVLVGRNTILLSKN
jgi:hypothetical protein